MSENRRPQGGGDFFDSHCISNGFFRNTSEASLNRHGSPIQSETSGDQWPERVQNAFIILCPVRNFWPAGHETLTCVPTLVTAELTTRSANGGHETAAKTTDDNGSVLDHTVSFSDYVKLSVSYRIIQASRHVWVDFDEHGMLVHRDTSD